MENATALVEACLNGSPSALRRHLPEFLRVLLPLLKSPLAAPRMTQCYLLLRHAAFEHKETHYGESVVTVFACGELLYLNTLNMAIGPVILKLSWTKLKHFIWPMNVNEIHFEILQFEARF